jgi:hypothetical protein
MIKSLKKPGIEPMYLSIIKDIYFKPTANIVLNEETFNIRSYKENANKNNTEIPSHHGQNGYHQGSNQVLARMQGGK